MGLNGSWRNRSSMSSRTRSVASVQISMSSWRRSSSVMMPRRNWDSTFSARFSNSSRICCLRGGLSTSWMDTVTPARDAQWKPRVLSLFSTSAVSVWS